MSKTDLFDHVIGMVNQEALLELAKRTLEDILNSRDSKELFSKSPKRSLFVNAFMTGFMAGATTAVEEILTEEKAANFKNLN